MARIHNFGAGPAALPLPVLQKAQAELLDYAGTGMSIMEMSHRSKTFEQVIQAAEANMRKILGISNDYAVLFLQGGASGQFAQIPMNLLVSGQTADYVHTGAWAEKAIKEAKNIGSVNVAWDGKAEKYMRMPAATELKLTKGAAYVHVTSNETIGGVQFKNFPKTEAPLVADMSSDIMCRAIDVNQFGLIYAGAQKNIGPSGLVLVIVRKDLTERVPEKVPAIYKYKTHMPEPSLYHTPNTWAIYLVKLVTEWVDSVGGLAKLQAINEQKAKLLYDTLDGSAYWKPCAHKDSRSIMNVTWRLGTEELENKFCKEATAAGLDGLKGHRSVGGIRASIYNAVSLESVQALVNFMKEFEKKNG
ncbi:MAG TPA: 3-phosphoserine/phosphohydroxythreonine transaminase [Planctomycetota bacterium]|nr:3-phosphoserine/phosphohydroxythreonine transaminase [Planctomycetota bacterium]